MTRETKLSECLRQVREKYAALPDEEDSDFDDALEIAFSKLPLKTEVFRGSKKTNGETLFKNQLAKFLEMTNVAVFARHKYCF